MNIRLWQFGSITDSIGGTYRTNKVLNTKSLKKDQSFVLRIHFSGLSHQMILTVLKVGATSAAIRLMK